MSFVPVFRAATLAVGLTFAGAVTLMPGTALAQTPPSAASTKSAPAQSAGSRSIEARIKALHDQLKVTAAEEAQWKAVAQAMRDSAQTTGALIADRAKNAKSMTAIDDLHSYRAVLQSHVDGIDKLTTAFEALYGSMPDAQKKIADAVFSRRPTRAARPKNG
ncbi:MAG TPA: Spy/CpxP family protein refolding chaperone [Stellaceae bacterium]|jgi:hypothetical protein